MTEYDLFQKRFSNVVTNLSIITARIDDIAKKYQDNPEDIRNLLAIWFVEDKTKQIVDYIDDFIRIKEGSD